jgi:hypothetical protein
MGCRVRDIALETTKSVYVLACFVSQFRKNNLAPLICWSIGWDVYLLVSDHFLSGVAVGYTSNTKSITIPTTMTNESGGGGGSNRSSQQQQQQQHLQQQ